MAEDAVFNIIIGVQNRERIKQLENDIADAEKEINKLSAAINTAGQATTQQANQLRMYGRDIGFARQEIESLSKENIKLGQAAEHQGASGVRTMTRALYQMDEGSKSLMYSLPVLAEQLGGSGPLAAAIGITAVAMVELAKHWDDLQAIFDNREGIDAAKSNLESLVDYMENLDSAFGEIGSGFLSMIKESFEQSAIKAKIEGFEKKRIGEGKGILEGPSVEEQKRGRVFSAAVKAYGPDKLFGEARQRIQDAAEKKLGKNLSPHQQDKIESMVQEMAGQAATGTLTPEARKAFGPKFGKELEAQQSKEDFLLEQEAIREEATERKAGEAQIEQNKKAKAAKQKKWESDEEKIMRSDEEFNKKRQEAILQDQITQLERQKRGQAEGFHERQLDNKFTFHRGGQAIAEAYQTDATAAIQKNQLQVQKAMQAGIDAVKDQLVAIRRQGLGAAAQ